MNFPAKSFLMIALVVLVVAAWFRFAALDLKPIHHDECVNYVFTKNLLQKGEYKYNPTAYHGPFLYYVSAPVVWVGGYTKTVLRFTPALFGLLTVVLVLLLARSVGGPGALFAAAVTALSPADVYYDRTLLHEVYFAFGLVGMTWAFLEATVRRKAYGVVAFYVSLLICFANKETAAFHVVAFALAMVAAQLYVSLLQRDQPFSLGPLFGRGDGRPLFLGLSIALALWTLLFSSLFRHPAGLVDFFRAYLPWFETGFKKPTHVKEWHYFLRLIAAYYWPALPFAFWAIGRGMWTRRARTAALMTMTLALTALYSAIPYKTPWCIISMGLAWVLLAADGFSDLWQVLRRPMWRGVLAAVALAALGVYGYYSYRLNFLEYDFNHNRRGEGIKHDIVYVQTQREYEQLPADLAKIAEADGRETNLPILVSAGSKNPGRFYLHDYKKLKVVFNNIPEKIMQAVALVRENEKDKYAEHYDGEYFKYGAYPVFPGWTVNLMVREDLWQKLLDAGLAEAPSPL